MSQYLCWPEECECLCHAQAIRSICLDCDDMQCAANNHKGQWCHGDPVVVIGNYAWCEKHAEKVRDGVAV